MTRSPQWTIGRVALGASAAGVKAFLAKFLAEASFPICGIQVDGGTDSKSSFEAQHQARGLKLFVMPPKRPEIDGGLERARSPAVLFDEDDARQFQGGATEARILGSRLPALGIHCNGYVFSGAKPRLEKATV